MNPITRLFSEELIQALGWTMLHSLWQGLAVVLLLMASMLLLRRRPPQLRYLLSVGAVLLVVVLAISTFLYLYLPAIAVHGVATDVYPAASGSLLAGVVADAAAGVSAWQAMGDRLSGFFRQYAPLLVAVWLLGIFVLGLRMLGELVLIQQLRHSRSHPLGGKLQEVLDSLSRRMGIDKKVELRESLRIGTPLVIGIWRPVILLPVGLVAGLSPRQVESILAHELAHIRRYDYLANILQSLAEIILFFNPAIWWISSLIRIEREHCCDDIAVGLTGDAVTLVKTLASLEEYRQANAGLAMGFMGRRSSLLGRIQRLLGDDDQSNRPFRFFWSAAVMLMVLLGFAFANPRPEPPVLAPEPEEVLLSQDPLSGMTAVASLSEEPPEAEAGVAKTITKPVKSPARDTIPRKDRDFQEEKARLEQEYRARMLELEKMVSDLQKQEQQVKARGELDHRTRQKELLELEKQVQEMISRKELEAKDLQLAAAGVRARIADLEVEFQSMRNRLNRELGKEKQDRKQINELEAGIEKLMQEKLELEKEANAREFEGQKERLEMEKERQILLNERMAVEKDLQIQLYEQQMQAMELQQQMREVQMQMEEFNHDFQLQLLELERRMLKREE